VSRRGGIGAHDAGVVSGAAVQPIRSRSSDERVVAGTSREPIVAVAALQRSVAREDVVAQAAVHCPDDAWIERHAVVPVAGVAVTGAPASWTMYVVVEAPGTSEIVTSFCSPGLAS